MSTKKYCFLFTLILVSLLEIVRAETDIYVFTDFGGGHNQQNQSVIDWQTAIELSSEGWKLAKHPRIFINDGAASLDPVGAGKQLAAIFPYLGPHSNEKINRIVVHVIDPEVGNHSQHPRSLTLRKDGTLFIGPDNGTLSLACPPDSIADIYEINSKRISEIIDIDLDVGGTFHGRDLFAASAYLLAAEKVTLQEIGKRYLKPELKYRIDVTQDSIPIQFQQISTTRWDVKLNETSECDLFATAYFLTIVQSPFFVEGVSPQLFFIEHHDNSSVAIFNRRTNNLYVGPNNGVGTSFFKGFSPEEVSAYSLDTSTYQKIRISKNAKEAFDIICKQPSAASLAAIDLLSHVDASSSDIERTIRGRIWIDAYGNIKTTLDSDTLLRLFNQGYAHIAVTLNGVTKPVQFASSFAEVPNGEAFLYVGSSGTIGPNPHRSHRYIELSCNGNQGVFGADLFINKNKAPFSGQEIVFRFTRNLN
jgi:S-adenosylmethionine hydrolase